MRKVSAWAAAHAPAGPRWGKRALSLLLSLALCLTLLPGAALAADGAAFRDISGHWAEETIAEWQESGSIGGYGDGTFHPDSSITRAEFVKLLNRALGLTAAGSIAFADVKESDWFYAEVAKAAAAGYATGSDGMFRPNAPITRAEAAAMLTRALALTADESRAAQFADASAIPAWAKGSVGAVAGAGYMTGYPGGTFGASSSITRAEAVVTLDRTQNVTVTADGTVLSDKTVAGDLIIAASVGEGEVTLKNVTVEGDLIIRGGGANSVYLDGVTVEGEVRLEKENLHLRLLGGTKLGTVVVVAKVKISGSGTIESLIVSVSGVTIAASITIRKTETADGAKAPTVSGSGSSSGSGSGGTVTPPAQQEKTVTGIAEIAPITVDYGTSEADARAKLPAEVTLNCSDGSTVTAAVTGWTVSGYDEKPKTTTGYPAAGTVTVPDGYTNSGDTLTVTATLTVRGGDWTVKNIVAPTGKIEVPYMTSEADAMKRLPSEVQLETYSPGTMVFAAVTWAIKDGQTYKPDTAATITYVGTVTIPDGYQWDGEMTIEANIVVLPNGETAKDKLVGSTSYTADVYVDSYTEDLDEIKESLPDQIRLQCKDDSWITVTVDKTKWQEKASGDADGYVRYSFNYPYRDIPLPAGYAFTSELNSADVGIYVKDRELEALQTALDAAREQLDRMADTEEAALYFTEKVYIAPDNTAASAIATGAKFVYNSEIEQVKNTLSDWIQGTNEASDLCTVKNLTNQNKIDAAAKEINKAAAAFQEALEQHTKLGTGYTQANILANIKKWLDENSNYAYSRSMQPLTVEKHGANGIPLPQIATDIQINAAGDTADISLTWSIADDTYAELRTNRDTGAQYVWVKGTATEPRDLSLTVKATTYQDANGNTVTLNEQVEAYNNLIVGAPIIRYPNTSGDDYVNVEKLTSGKAQTFGIQIPLQYNDPKIKAIDGQVTAECSDGSLTGITVNDVASDGDDQRGDYTVLQARLTATAQQLDAVVASDTPVKETDYEIAEVTLLIPYGAVTLTDWATEQGWYVPKTGLALEAEVWVCNPAIKIGTINTTTVTGKVTVAFESKNWSCGYTSVWMALVPEEQTSYTGKEAYGFISDGGTGVSVSDCQYDVNISADKLTEGTRYAVWVRFGDGPDWHKSSTTYTHTTGN